MTAYRYRPGARYRYPRRLRRRGGNAEKLIGVAVAIAAAASLSAGGHHAGAGARAATAAAAAPVTSGGEPAFIGAVLADLGAPDDAADAGSLAAWFTREWPSYPPGAENDPLDTTLAMPGSWNFNTFDGDLHVQAYPTASEGAQATAMTLDDGYPLIVAALRSGAGVCGGGFASELGTWSGDGYQEVC
jgi:hypothetical protein